MEILEVIIVVTVLKLLCSSNWRNKFSSNHLILHGVAVWLVICFYSLGFEILMRHEVIYGGVWNWSLLFASLPWNDVSFLQSISPKWIENILRFCYLSGYRAMIIVPALPCFLCGEYLQGWRYVLSGHLVQSILIFPFFILFSVQEIWWVKHIPDGLYREIDYGLNALGLSYNCFPSMHTSIATAMMYVAISEKDGFFRWGWLIYCGLVIFSTVYFPIHWVLDMVAGMVLGIVSAILGSWLAKMLYQRIEEKISIPGASRPSHISRRILDKNDALEHHFCGRFRLKRINDLYRSGVLMRIITAALLILFLGMNICLANPDQVKPNNDAISVVYNAIMEDNPGLGSALALRTAQAIVNSSNTWGVDPMYAASFFKQESHFDMNAVSGVGATGIAQLMPDTAAWMGVTDIYNLEQNVDGGIHYMRYLIDHFAGEGYSPTECLQMAISAYNAGDGAVDQYHGVPPYEETMNYVVAVARNYAEMAGQALSGLAISVMPKGMFEIDVGNKFAFLNADFNAAKPLQDMIELTTKTCLAGIRLIQDYVLWLFFTLAAIDLALSAMWNLFEDDGHDVLQWLLRRFLKYGFLLFMLTHWGDIIGNSIRGYFVAMGAAAGGIDTTTAGQYVSDPAMIVEKGMYLIGPILSYINRYHGVAILLNFGSVLIAIVLLIGIVISFIAVGIQIMLAYIEFYIVVTLSVVSMGFSPLRQTKFAGEKGLWSVVAVSMKLMVFCFYVAIMTTLIQNWQAIVYDFASYLKLLLVSILFWVMSGRVHKTANRLFAGAGFRF